MITSNFNTRYTCNHAWQHILLPCMTALCLMTSCSSDKVIEEIEEIKPSNDPMKFTCNVQENVSSTRASYLKSDFMVSAYKSYGLTKQQTVMDKYHVEHRTTGTNWDGNEQDNWDYVGVDGQIERYWDYDNYPYRFNAIAPCPAKTDVTLADKNLTISKSYSFQTCSDGVKDPADNSIAEPYMLAQVQRATDGKDTDIFAGSPIGDENSNTTLNRYVALPFHHLNSKIRFGVYSLNPWATDNKLYIKDLVITATSTSKFVTKADKYTASGTNSWKVPTGTSGFEGLTKAIDATTPTQLFSFSGLSGSTPLEDNDLRKHQGQSSAYFLLCNDGIMQIPQEGVEMKVSLKLMQEGNDTPFKAYTDVPVVLRLEDNTTQVKFNWVSGNIYTYYLILDFDKKLEIQFTATLAPWEDISGSLSTDLEQ